MDLFNNKDLFIKKIMLHNQKHNYHNKVISMFIDIIQEPQAKETLLSLIKTKNLIAFSINKTKIIIEYCCLKKAACRCNITISNNAGIPIIYRNKINKITIQECIKAHCKINANISQQTEIIEYLFSSDISSKLLDETILKPVITCLLNSLGIYGISVIYTSLKNNKIIITPERILIPYIIWIIEFSLESDNLILSLVLDQTKILLKKIICYDDGLNIYGITSLFVKNINSKDKEFINTLDIDKYFTKTSSANNARKHIMTCILHNITNSSMLCSITNMIILSRCLKLFKNNITNTLKKQSPSLTAYLCSLQTFNYKKSSYWYTKKNIIYIKAAGVKIILSFAPEGQNTIINIKYLSGEVFQYNSLILCDITKQYKFNKIGLDELRFIYAKNRHFFSTKKDKHNNLLTHDLGEKKREDELVQEQEQEQMQMQMQLQMQSQTHSSMHLNFNISNEIFNLLDSILYKSNLSYVRYYTY